jgi:hypothetical protein
VDPDVSPDTDAGTSGFNGQLEGSVFSGGSCQLHTTDQGAPSGFLPLMMVLASLVILPVRARLKNK